jgi:3-oxoadipate enol-lactonase
MPPSASDSARIHYAISGPVEAPALVLSNSLGTDFGMWGGHLEELAQHFRVLRYDHRGHGGSEVPRGAYTVAMLAGDLLALLDRLGIARFDFCGLSLGGQVGMWLALQFPERVRRLVLCNTAAHIPSPASWNARIEAVRKHGMSAIAETVLRRWFSESFLERDPATVERLRRMLLATPPEGYAGCCAAVRDFDVRERVRQIRCPALVVTGSCDPATPPEQGRFLAREIPGARLRELEASHLSNLEQPCRFNQQVLEFLLEEEEPSHGRS